MKRINLNKDVPMLTNVKSNSEEKKICKEILLFLIFFATTSNLLFLYIFATQCRSHFIFQTINFVRSNNLSLKYQRHTPSGCKDIEIIKFRFVANTLPVFQS